MPDADPDKPVRLLSCADEFEAGLRASTLRAAGIDARVVRTAGGSLNLGPAMGSPYDVYVRAADVERAREALRESAAAARSGAMRFDDDEREDGEDLATTGAETPEAPDALEASTAFVLGVALGLLTVFIPVVLAALLKTPLSRPEQTVLCGLWVLFFGMVAAAVRDRFPVSRFDASAREHDDGRVRRHFRDSPVALVGWFLLGAGFFGPATFFFVGVLLLPVANTLARYTTMAGPLMMGAWCVLCGFWTARHALHRQRARAAARRAPRLARDTDPD